MKDCKYRLPCNWCDKYDRMCEAVLLEIYKQDEKSMVRTDPKECEHDFKFYKSIENTGGKYTYYRCHKCGAMKMIDSDDMIYESAEWKH